MSIRRDWERFWFARFSPVPLGLFRILFGLVVFFYAALLFQDRNIWFGAHGIFPPSVIELYDKDGTPGPRPLNLLFLPFNNAALTAFFVVVMASALSLAAGFQSRFNSVLIWAALNCLHNRNPVIMNGSDILMVVMAFYLMLSPSGAACSVDRCIAVWRGKAQEVPASVAAWPIRLMQLQLTCMYLCAFLAKTSGKEWSDGTAVYYATHLTELIRFPIPPMTQADLWFINALTYIALATELAMATVVWVPRLRLYVLAMAVMMHIGIEYSMNIPVFSAMVITCYTVMLTPRHIERFQRWGRRVGSRFAVQMITAGDAAHAPALRTLRTLDVFRWVSWDRWESDAPSQHPTCVDREGRGVVDAAAVRKLALRLPGLWLLVPVLFVTPLAAWVAQRLQEPVSTAADPVPAA